MSAIYLSTGRLVDPFDIEKYDFTAEELIHPICHLARYSGQTKLPYYVGEHEHHLIEVVPPKLKRAAALHDLNEGLTNDLPRPFKSRLPDFCVFEERVQRHIFDIFGEPWENMEALSEYDTRICTDEMAQAFAVPYYREQPGLGVEIQMWPSELVKAYLTEDFRALGLL